MINYFSTRGDVRRYNFSEAILKGIATDGGLFVPEKIPLISDIELKSLVGKSYQDLALYIFQKFETDFNNDLLERIINNAYGKNFHNGKITPLHKLKDNQYILELFHGPTLAFKDIALQIMPLLFEELLQRQNKLNITEGKSPIRYLILTATSGDTGSAVMEGFNNRKNVSIFVLYPEKGISKVQRIQMINRNSKSAKAVAVKGDFDNAQRIIKDIFQDGKFSKMLLKNYNTVLSSANSINWGRLIPQIVYHIRSYTGLISAGVINSGDLIDIAVPTGNFGNILAAFYAKKMGLPVRKLICASNANNVLTHVLQTGKYDVSKKTLTKTPSPSMDILIASNFERLLYEITKDTEKVSLWMRDLKEKRYFEMDKKTKELLRNLFHADWVSNYCCLKTIRRVFYESDYLVDPHTAVAQAVVERYQKKYGLDTPIVICSTAHWVKFAKEIYKSLKKGRKSDDQNELRITKNLQIQHPVPAVPDDFLIQTDKHQLNETCEPKSGSVKNIIDSFLHNSVKN